ncbi:oxalate oxidase [Vararia minispora EC-137]|uniref:Oxalate oxidase n=1 Tax=Vararia minispora EC-137 TaxID=1314806 RepID=A0ACB8QML9_9AGAM|nr:oxalate oxidase [Vararia minispora EC-137]
MLTTLFVYLALAAAAPTSPTPASSAPPEYETVKPISQNLNAPIFPVADTSVVEPEPMRGTLGANILGPQNVPLEHQNPDLLAPPTTDEGIVGNAKWPFTLSTNRLQTGGWARQQNTVVFPIAKNMAGVNMRLEAGAIRELHWHTTAEWSYVLKGTTQITAVDTEGRNFVANVGPGDLWYFPPGCPHSLQGTDPDGTEFLLVFPDGAFNEDATLLLTDFLSHVPLGVLSKNFGLPPSAFDHVPSQQLYIFPSQPPTSDAAPEDPYGQVQSPFAYNFSQVPVTPLAGGSVKIADSRVFNIATEIAVAEVTVEPGAMRELHWHPTEDEWAYFIDGYARVTLFQGSSTANTFDYEPGDIGYVPSGYGHYVENVGNTTLRYLEVFNTAVYQDVSLSQWLAVTPPALVQAHLGWDEATINQLNKTKPVVVKPYSP